jgi:hypothetical protein
MPILLRVRAMSEVLTSFEHDAQLIAGKLTRTIKVSEFSATNHSSYKAKLEGILNTPQKRGGRTDEAIIGDALSGMVAELAVARLLDVEVYDVPWDLKDPHSYGKDVVYRTLNIEIKSHKHLRRFTISSKKFGTLLKLRQHRTYDVIVFVHVERAEEGWWNATPTLIVDPWPATIEFTNLWDDDEFSKIYRADLAAPRDLCYPLINLEA